MEIWLLTYLFIMNGIEKSDADPRPLAEDICETTKGQLEGYEYNDKYPFQDVRCERRD